MATTFQSTFTADNGDTWIFDYDATTGSGTVRGSDVDEEFKVIEGVAYNLVMDKAEETWLLEAWEEATGRRSSLRDLANL